MAQTMNFSADEMCPDPFAERTAERHAMDVQVLGGQFRFSSDHAALLDVVAMAYGGLPSQLLPGIAPAFQIELRLSPARQVAENEPPLVQMQSGAGFLCGVMDASNYAVLFPQQRRALIVASPDMLARPYHLRYELIEFTVFTLATRALGLVPLHAACVGWHGRGALVMGASGAGKSTLALHAWMAGLEFLSEDAVFVHAQGGQALGVANYLHVTPGTLQLLGDDGFRHDVERSPVIRRRSGVEKYEVDLRGGRGHLAQGPLDVACVVFASRRYAQEGEALITAMSEQEISARLAAEQPYAASRPGWDGFVAKVKQWGAYELRRGTNPFASVDAVKRLLG